MTVRVPFYPQLSERDCGATCLRMIAKAHGISISMERARDLSQTTFSGADLAGIAKGAESLGFDTLAAELPYEELLKGDLLPCILHWDRDHFVVLQEVSLDKAKLLDPAKGPRELSRDAFEAHRYGPGRSRVGLIIRPGLENRIQEDKDSPSSRTGTAQGSKAYPLLKAFHWTGLLLGLFFAGALALSFFFVLSALQVAVDLQYREGWLANAGTLLSSVAALMLAAYLLRREAISQAGEASRMSNERLFEVLQSRAKTLDKAGSPDVFLQAMSDLDDLLVWRSYKSAEWIMSIAAVLISLIFLLAIQLYWGVALAIVLLLLGWLQFAADSSNKVLAESAREAQRRQRQAVFEYAHAVPDNMSLGIENWLAARVQQGLEQGRKAYYELAFDTAARRELHRLALLLGLTLLLSVGLYLLGYSGLQVAELLMGMILIGVALFSLPQIAVFQRSWQALRAAQLRLAELAVPAEAGNGSNRKFSEAIQLKWRSTTGQEQSLSIPKGKRMALVGSDASSRIQLVEALLGRENQLMALPLDDEGQELEFGLQSLGKTAIIRPDSLLMNASILHNITLGKAADDSRLRQVTPLLYPGLDASNQDTAALLSMMIGFNGAGIAEGMASRILLARALYHEALYILIDRATHELSPFEEALLLDEVAVLAKGRTIIFNSDRIDAAAAFDRVAHIEGSDLVASGHHDQLLAEKGAYFYQQQLNRRPL